ncbi:6,7-dimethyl-8-ribityllumazine synthase [Methylobacterium gnaphalii]|uniref:6,7-dimethyl-8-ribityllumazine synthase n=1 Tax=Methylobacterium gnaphalii TaxID=1010610 RepID=A0A512JJZ4_9HYPH|nr:6,7-dimethyl-8-ribityllumazine synthase [Methylobacterium gnaphalii]GEP10243.1 6,7-dimethyl-8-ribityllumazine synthase 1 [Methylobacterium gnaphalii]GJD68599.1 6,7-dimethyl-8-ribityllumazine synthase 1 [Methylobacterium gnaphalii]GLS48760.1 6,7-dimethyl-8-ribityllumazine synthase 1 [Methylobacterium gnaphalii]
MVSHRREASAPIDSDGARVLVIEARFYDDVADALLDGARHALDEAGAQATLVTVPGALELPAAIAILVDSAKRAERPYDAVVALGCVIRGETSHYDTVANESARGLMDLSVAERLPLGNGILTVENHEQAMARARREEMDKGGGAARAALAVLALKRQAAEQAR